MPKKSDPPNTENQYNFEKFSKFKFRFGIINKPINLYQHPTLWQWKKVDSGAGVEVEKFSTLAPQRGFKAWKALHNI